MSDALNPRQFTSLDYADADMYGALTERPTTATPLKLPLGQLVDKDKTGALSPGELAHYRSEEARRQTLFREENEAYNARMNALREREIARNLSLLKTRSNEIAQPIVSSRDYEKKFLAPSTIEEWSPPPSTGSPPPTPNGTSARGDSLVEPTATPRSAAIRESIGNAVGGIGQSLPKSLPQAAGRLVIPGVGAGLTFAGALIAGQSVQQAATSTVIVTGASVAGGLIGTAVGGVIGGYVGSMVGGFVGGYLANALLPQPLPSTTAHLESYTPNYTTTAYGQSPGILYIVSLQKFNSLGEVTDVRTFELYGQLIGIKETQVDTNRYNAKFVSSNGNVVFDLGDSTSRWKIASVVRKDGAIDIYPENGSPSPPPDNSPYRYDSSPIGDDNAIPSGKPSAGKNKGETHSVAPSMPSNNTPNGARGFVGHGGLVPSYLPNPTQQTSNLGGMLPRMQPLPQKQSLPFAEPEDVAVPRITPMLSSGEASTTSLNPGIYAFPAYVPDTAKPIPLSDAHSPVPKSKSQPTPKTPEQAANEKQQDDIKAQLGQLTAIATALAALTPAIQGIPNAIASNPNVRQANRDDVQGAVCEISQPTGCLGAPIKKAEDAAKANGDKLDELNAALSGLNTAGSAAQLALLNTINGKLGAQVTGGISGFMQQIAENTYIDKAIGLLTLATTLHNALMLSANIGQTLGQIINTVVGFILPKGVDGTPIDLGAIIGKTTEDLIKDAIGAEQYTTLTQDWAKVNRIYQSTANVFNAVTSLGQTVINALEMIGSMTGKIGNGLLQFRTIGEGFYERFNPQPNYKFGKLFTFLENVQQDASTIQAVVQVPVDIVQQVNSGVEAVNELKTNLGQPPNGVPGIETPVAAVESAKAIAVKAASVSPELSDADKANANE
ncbi:hypothetical protein [Nostoc sp.]|uniref:hypothetical protein n=1 Tax=Nostoc sp. TaxID=1180 RepID=UPI002FF8019E